jgi:hypothetical protein
LRARVATVVLSFFAAFAAAGTPVLPAAAVAAAACAPALGGEGERTPIASPQHEPLQVRAAREAGPRPGFWKLPPHTLTLRLVAALVPTVQERAADAARAPIAPPAAPRSCRGPPRTA